MFTAAAVAQSPVFVLSPQGFQSTADPSQDYVVLEGHGDQQATYSSALRYLHTLYRNPDEALSTVDGEMITINGFSENAIHRNGMHVFDMNYTVTLRFKDGRMRMDAPSFKLTTYGSNGSQELHLVWTGWSLGGDDLGIYGKNEKLKSDRAKEDLESYFNDFAADLQQGLTETASSDW